jgi:hypothetical protein
MRLGHDFVSVARVGSVDDLQVVFQKYVIEISPCSEVEQIEPSLFLVVEIVCWVWVGLHDLPLKQLPKAQFQHQCTNPVALLLACLNEHVDLDSFDKLSAENFPAR